MKNLTKISIIYPQIPAPWPSVSFVQPILVSIIQEIGLRAKTVNILDKSKPSLSDDLWVFPLGTVQIPILVWMNNSFKTPYNRPPALFFLGGEGAKLGYHLWHYRHLFRADDQWIVSSEAEKNLIDHFFPGNNRTSFLPYPTAKNFKPLKSKTEILKLRSKLKIAENKKVILYAGRLSRQKNILSLLDLIESKKNYNLLFCGDIDLLGTPHLPAKEAPNISNSLIKEIGMRGLTKKIEFRPFQSQIELQKIMQVCDYQVSLSAHYGEDFGYSIAQGLACGLKTILSDWGGHRNWKFLEQEKSVSYVDLNWEKGIDIGVPDLNSLSTFPRNSPLNFSNSYNKEIKDKLKLLIYSPAMLVNNGPIVTHPEIKDFWDLNKKTPRSTMFISNEDTLFKKVVKAYQGHEI